MGSKSLKIVRIITIFHSHFITTQSPEKICIGLHEFRTDVQTGQQIQRLSKLTE